MRKNGKIPQHQSPNGCHYKFSKKVYEFIVSLDKEEAQGSDTKAAAEAAVGHQLFQFRLQK